MVLRDLLAAPCPCLGPPLRLVLQTQSPPVKVSTAARNNTIPQSMLHSTSGRGLFCHCILTRLVILSAKQCSFSSLTSHYRHSVSHINLSSRMLAAVFGLPHDKGESWISMYENVSLKALVHSVTAMDLWKSSFSSPQTLISNRSSGAGLGITSPCMQRCM